ncbi:MAG: M20/M25/M40 family metallo-hydrolase [Gammaproteobacteria bacterium]|jgi:glutamate carboxypeptidase|nr:M20/M25/M40 family metallo-hydrolase [Gammaproteobacteria bacterium]MBT5203541.1 M20/M25/M40 family metallo-hydrolase [Gammaproteobacteria bacterium]MBT5601526.1 M20/M25/M40 family metallo-hydrolase [Gammaproteobacteria bacterium]MBT6245746.1 M20/M25/M40 family metallo-hydrolase [Gammaproteobacteria bacterium]
MIRLIGLCLVLTASATFAELTEIESRISEVARQKKDSAIALLEEVVNINSGTMNHEGVREVGTIFRRELDRLGFNTSWHDMSSVNRSGHLFADNQGNGVCQLLIGHLDTVFEKTSPFQRFIRNADQAFGPGVNDMKGGDVVIIMALETLAEIGVLDESRYIVAMTGDEEKSGNPKSVSRAHLLDAAEQCDLALGFEYAKGLDTAAVARRGSSGWTLEVSGKRAHSSRIFSDDVGSGAIFEAARILTGFYEQVRGEEYLSFNPGIIAGGTEVNHSAVLNSAEVFGKTNVVAQSVIIQGGLRTISRKQELEARKAMQEVVENGSLPETAAEINFSDGYPAMSPSQGNMALFAVLDSVSQDLGYGTMTPGNPGLRGAADVSFVADYVDAVDGIGAEGNGAHTLNESIDLSTLPLLIERAALLMYRLSQGRGIH